MEFVSLNNNLSRIDEFVVLAKDIWNEYWPPRIGQDQTNYMVDKFQSKDAVLSDIANNAYEYWFIEDNGRVIGYTGGHIEPKTNRYFISKIYLKPDERGHGLSKRIIEFYENICKERNFDAMYLTVNKKNEQAIKAYEKNGFSTIECVETDIGSGFIMDDFIMEKSI